jgi:hypothetical protein
MSYAKWQLVCTSNNLFAYITCLASSGRFVWLSFALSIHRYC